jgi:Bacterial PH domain
MTETYAPPAWQIALCVLAAVVLGVFAFSLDPAGRLLVGVAALGLLGTAVVDAARRPVLSVGPHGVQVAVGWSRRTLPWAAVKQVRAGTISHSRRFVHQRTLEIDTVDELIVLSRRQLGRDPGQVADVIEERRMRASPASPE